MGDSGFKTHSPPSLESHVFTTSFQSIELTGENYGSQVYPAQADLASKCLTEARSTWRKPDLWKILGSQDYLAWIDHTSLALTADGSQLKRLETTGGAFEGEEPIRSPLTWESALQW